ncbi:hypothetical protein I7I51_08216 [Histoplasma capsulatum]|uniref:Uncharacterized protein n=1 Tax=Ajellomyces capsulatus TaxID=5037 RepID=A0A8A1M3N2_AJECA|nr:hypothetical protein I7I51_08216 [Histoplasma capsulatum]
MLCVEMRSGVAWLDNPCGSRGFARLILLRFARFALIDRFRRENPLAQRLGDGKTGNPVVVLLPSPRGGRSRDSPREPNTRGKSVQVLSRENWRSCRKQSLISMWSVRERGGLGKAEYLRQITQY